MGNRWSGRGHRTTTPTNSEDKAKKGWDNSRASSLLPQTAVVNNLSNSVSQPDVDSPGDTDVQGITIYRSYSVLAPPETETELSAGVSVYESRKRGHARVRWVDCPGTDVDEIARRQTLPRHYGRSGRTPTTLHHSETMPPGGARRPQRRQRVSLNMLDSDWTTGSHGIDDDLRLNAPHSSAPGSRRRSYYTVSDDDFPTTSTIKRRVDQFKTNFARDVVTLYTELTETVQLNTLSIAVKRDQSDHTLKRLSLWQYFNCPDVAVELHSADSDALSYTIIISTDHFRSVMAARRDRTHVTSLVRQLVSCVANDAAAELARVYEYQLALLGDGLAAMMLAAYAARCVIDYVICGGRYLERDTVVMGAVKSHARQVSGEPIPTVSVVVGERELKWRLDEILTKPGLRLEIYLCSEDYQDREEKQQLPWLFLTSHQHDPGVYGYRAAILERRYPPFVDAAAADTDADTANAQAYCVCDSDEAMFTTPICPNNDGVAVGGGDFHRRYRPYQRLVATPIDDDDSGMTSSDAEAMALRFARDDVTLVHRRLIRRSQIGGLSVDTDVY